MSENERVVVEVEVVTPTLGVPVVPAPQTAGAAGQDLCAAEDAMVQPGGIVMVRTGIRLALPEGYEGQVRPRSGLAAKHGVTVLNAPGTIDSDYRGEVKVLLVNHGQRAYMVHQGDRIAQLVVARYTRVELVVVPSLGATARGDGGFGSTGG